MAAAVGGATGRRLILSAWGGRRLAALPLRLLAPILLVLGLFFAVSPASAHRLNPGSGGGIPIPSLVHGQMAVYAPHWDEIMRLAARNPTADENFRRVANYARIQRAWCLWGLMPGAISDEDSPFNECSHAYLAAARALLDELREDANPGSAAARLAETIDHELLQAGALAVCGYSGEDFNTADHIVPHWNLVAGHGPTLVLFLGGGGILLGAMLLFLVRQGGSAPSE